MAGESAEDLARRQRERAERLMRSAEMYERGAQGEKATGAILDALQADGWAVLHDVRWPGRPRANIDHIAIGPGGVFVIDSKNWSGQIDVRDNTFRSNGRRQDKTVAAAGDAALAVAGLLSAPAAATVRPVLCFVRDEPVEGLGHEVMLCSTANLREMLLSRPAVLPLESGRVAFSELSVLLRPANSTPASRSARRPLPVPIPRTSTTSRKRKQSFSGALIKLGVLVVVGTFALTQLPRFGGAAADEIADRITNQLVGHRYASCQELRADYPNGVGTSAAVEKLKRKHKRPAAEASVYAANTRLDTDGDGLACERPVTPS
jgi:Nuclease-related domain/Excalibur calcium-binding domain